VSTPESSRDSDFGAFVKARMGEMSVQDLANTLDKSTVTVYKMLSGERRFSGDPDVLADVLELSDDDRGMLKHLHRGRAPIADTVKQRRRNTQAQKSLRERLEQLESNDRVRLELLQKTQRLVENDFLDPFLRFVATVDDLADGLTELDLELDPNMSLAEDLAAQQAVFVSAMGKMSEEAADAAKAAGLAAGAAGVGAAVGGTAAFALFTGVAAFGTASTGAAIGGLTGAAATSATLAAIGGGSLAVGGLGVAGGTAILAGLVVGPAVIGLAAGALLADRYVYRREIEQAETLDEAERAVDQAESEARVRWQWARRQGRLLDRLHLATEGPMRNIGNVRPHAENGRISWNEIAMWHADVALLVRALTLAVVAMSLPTWTPEADVTDLTENAKVDDAYRELDAAIDALAA
jgi:CHASE3 domain sensor protein